MGYCADAFAVPFDEIARIRGSGDRRLLAELTRDYADHDDEDDYEDDEDRPPRLSEALASIINGTPIEDGYWPTYAEASSLIYARLGPRLNSNAISPSNPAHLEACNSALHAEGIEDRLPIFNFGRKPPLLDEPPEPFPVLSHMTPDEVAAMRGVLDRIDWSRYGHAIEKTMLMVKTWIDQAADKGYGIVCEYG